MDFLLFTPSLPPHFISFLHSSFAPSLLVPSISAFVHSFPLLHSHSLFFLFPFFPFFLFFPLLISSHLFSPSSLSHRKVLHVGPRLAAVACVASQACSKSAEPNHALFLFILFMLYLFYFNLIFNLYYILYSYTLFISFLFFIFLSLFCRSVEWSTRGTDLSLRSPLTCSMVGAF